MMYYFVPKQSGNRSTATASIVGFSASSLIWAGPHHLIYTSLPDWAQTLGTAFSVMLILPSWGGMLNGFLTLKGSWHKLRTDPILKFLVLGITFYGMSTFEGPMMAVKSVNALTHYSNYTIGHVHGTLGWVAFTSFAALYYMVPRVWGTRLYSARMADPLWMGSGRDPLRERDGRVESCRAHVAGLQLGRQPHYTFIGRWRDRVRLIGSWRHLLHHGSS
jgi:cytochrome c oxidase cbb3-type subunit 1